MKRTYWLKIIIPILVTILLIWFLQILVMPKYMDESQEGAMIAEYYNSYNRGQNDVIFVGDCEVYENFSPVALWNSHGITSYIRGSAQQLIWQTYYLMEETFRYEKPKIMVFNVLEMIYDTPESTGDPDKREAYNRMTLDGMEWSKQKFLSISASLTKKEIENDQIWSYYFPILRFHDRITNLQPEDFQYLFFRDTVTDNGYLMQVEVNPVLGEFPKRPLVNYKFGKNAWYYLDMIRKLCEKNETQLVLIKAPSLSPVWYDEWEKQIEEYASDYNIPYYNFLTRQDEIGIDWNTDTYDRGLHLNVYGAEKLSNYFGKLLVEDFHLPDRRNGNDDALISLWYDKNEIYELRKKKMNEVYMAQLASELVLGKPTVTSK